MVDRHAPVRQHRGEIAVADRKRQIPAQRPQDHLGGEMPTLTAQLVSLVSNQPPHLCNGTSPHQFRPDRDRGNPNLHRRPVLFPCYRMPAHKPDFGPMPGHSASSLHPGNIGGPLVDKTVVIRCGYDCHCSIYTKLSNGRTMSAKKPTAPYGISYQRILMVLGFYTLRTLPSGNSGPHANSFGISASWVKRAAQIRHTMPAPLQHCLPGYPEIPTRDFADNNIPPTPARSAQHFIEFIHCPARAGRIIAIWRVHADSSVLWRSGATEEDAGWRIR